MVRYLCSKVVFCSFFKAFLTILVSKFGTPSWKNIEKKKEWKNKFCAFLFILKFLKYIIFRQKNVYQSMFYSIHFVLLIVALSIEESKII